MARRSVFRLSDIMTFCSNQPSLMKRGENALESNHVKKMVYDGALETLVGTVQASMKTTMYKVSIELDNGIVKAGHCECVKGMAVCHHMIALLLFAHYNVSVTDVPCKWDGPVKREDRNDGECVDDLFPRRKEGYRALQNPPGPEDLQFYRGISGMCGDGAAGFLWLLEPEPAHAAEPPVAVEIPSVKQVVNSKEFETAINKRAFLITRLAITWSTILKIAQLTVGQGSNPLWFEARTFRITSSNFGKVLRVPRRVPCPYCPSLMKELLGQYKKDGAHSIMWGRQNEDEALSAFCAKMHVDVQKIGLWLHESGLLGASPDGLVGDNAIVEAKCPYSLRNRKTIAEGVISSKKCFLIYENDTFSIDTKHDYWHQVQGLLWFTKRQYCYVVVWIPNDCIVVRVEYDDNWGKTLIF